MEGVLCGIIRILLMKKRVRGWIEKIRNGTRFWFRIVGCVPKKKMEK